VILDDGFQNRKVIKDIEILAVTGKKWGDTLFRDFASTLSRAHLVVQTKGLMSERVRSLAKNQLSEVSLVLPHANPAQRRVLLVSGVADSEALAQAVKECGYELFDHVVFRDHARYTREIAEQLLRRAETEKCRVLLTGKDWVKWRKLFDSANAIDSKVITVEPEIVFKFGRENWDRVLWAN
jgi:tetraacyldisaccharide-1-P 4'-kinase